MSYTTRTELSIVLLQLSVISECFITTPSSCQPKKNIDVYNHSFLMPAEEKHSTQSPPQRRSSGATMEEKKKGKRQPGAILHSNENSASTTFSQLLFGAVPRFPMQFLRTEDSGGRSNAKAQISKYRIHSGVTSLVARCAGKYTSTYVRKMTHWNGLFREAEDGPFLEVFKDGPLSNPV